MISIEMSISPWVWDSSGLRFRVQLMNKALRSEKSVSLSSHCFAWISFSSTLSAMTFSSARLGSIRSPTGPPGVTRAG